MTAIDTSAAPAPSAAENPKLSRMVVTVCAMIATLMQALDATIANVALPHMQGSLSATSDQITWVLTSYIVAAAIFTAPVGWFASRFGRKTIFMAAVIGFTIASALCGLAQSLDQMVLFRLMQGVCGAALVPLSQSLMWDMYPPEQRGTAMAMWGMGVMLGPILGPTLGGWLTDTFDWRWVFYVNVPFGIAAAVGLWFFLKSNGRDNALRFDWIGFGVLSLGLGAFQLMLDRGQQLDWFSSTEIVIEALIAALGVYLFIVHMLTAKKPFLSPSMFTDRNFVAGMVIMFTVGLVLLSSAALLPGYLQRLGGYSVTEAGLLMAPRGIGTMIAMMIAGRLTGRIDARVLMLFGISTMAFTLWVMTGWTPDVSRTELVWVTTLQGFGMGLVFIPLQVVAFATLPGQFRTDGASLFALMRNVGSAIGISVATWLLSVSSATMYSQLGENVTAFNQAYHIGAAGLFYNPNIPMGLAGISGEIARQAEIVAYANDFMFLFWVSIPAAFALLLMRKSKPHVPTPEEAAHAQVMD